MYEVPGAARGEEGKVSQIDEERRWFQIQGCDCGHQKCGTMILMMSNPVIKPLADTDELVCVLYCPSDHWQGMVDKIREIAEKNGVTVT